MEKQERRKVEGDRATEMEGEDRRRDAPAGGKGGRHQRSAIRGGGKRPIQPWREKGGA